MAISIPAPHHTMRQDWDSDPLRRGETNGGSLTHNTKSAGSLPVNAANATASTNNTTSNATGNPAFAFHAFQSSGGLDVSTDTKVLYYLLQFNAANRIQVSTLANDGICFRIGSGTATTSTPASVYKHYQMGGRDTPFGRQNAGIRAMVIDLNDTSNESANFVGGNFDNTDVTTYGVGTVRHNISGNSSNWYFRQPAFLFDTAKNAPNIPKFTGTGSDFDEFIDAILGTDFSDIISYDWVVRNGDILNIAAPMQIGDGATATTFNDQGKTIISPASNDPSDPRNRLTDQAMRLYWVPRNNAADTLTLTGTYIWGTAAPWDLDVSNAAIGTINGATFNGMGDITLGSSISGAATFNLSFLRKVIINGANLDGSNINGAAEIRGTTVSTFTNINALALDFDTAGTYTLDGCVIDTVGNSSIGNIILNLVNGASVQTNTDPGTITINNAVDISLSGIVPGSRVHIRDMTNGTNLFNQIIAGSTFTESLNYLSDITLRIRVRHASGTPKYKPVEVTETLTATGLSRSINQVLDE